MLPNISQSWGLNPKSPPCTVSVCHDLKSAALTSYLNQPSLSFHWKDNFSKMNEVSVDSYKVRVK